MSNLKLWGALLLALSMTAWIGCSDITSVANEADGIESLGVGNGLPSGPHFNLNLIGVSKEKTADMTGNKGRRIFVKESGNTKIMLTEGDFEVLDANGTDGEASFQLPNPDPDCDGTTEYSVFVRELGKPGGTGSIESCYTDQYGDDYCATDVDGGVVAVELARNSGKPVTRNVSRDLLYVDYCVDYEFDLEGNVIGCDRWAVSPLFADDLADYYWSLDNDGLKLVQLRFYEVPTEAWDPGDVEGPNCPV